MISNVDDELDPELKLINRKLNIGHMTSDCLAACIVTYKALGMDKDFAIAAMIELGRRRPLGEEFDFETWIQSELDKIPKIDDLDIVKIGLTIKNSTDSLREIIKK